MAPEKKAEAAPPWQRSSAERMEAYALHRRKAELPPAPTAPDHVLPVATSAASASSMSYQQTLAPSNPKDELQALRISGVVASSFNPARHAVMVEGRPVVALHKQTTARWCICCGCCALRLSIACAGGSSVVSLFLLTMDLNLPPARNALFILLLNSYDV
jgi:hypothetical protein